MGMMSFAQEQPLKAIRPDQERVATYGKRQDGSMKGAGYFGEIAHPDKPENFSTELTIGVKVDSKELNIPLLVPTLTQREIRAVLAGKESDTIIRKAVEHAKLRIRQGKSPYADTGEYYPLPKE